MESAFRVSEGRSHRGQCRSGKNLRGARGHEILRTEKRVKPHFPKRPVPEKAEDFREWVYLTHASGFTILLNRTGKLASGPFGYNDDGFSVTFDDTAANDIRTYRNSLGHRAAGRGGPAAAEPAQAAEWSDRRGGLRFRPRKPGATWSGVLPAAVKTNREAALADAVQIPHRCPPPCRISVPLRGSLYNGGWKLAAPYRSGRARNSCVASSAGR